MPKDRLNLTVDRAAIERARRFSDRHNTSISRLVNDFLSSLPLDPELADEDLSPSVRRLLGIASGDADRDAYRRHLLEKYSS